MSELEHAARLLEGELNRTRAQRDELLEAGNGMANIIETLLEGGDHSDTQLLELLEDWVIAREKAEGKQ